MSLNLVYDAFSWVATLFKKMVTGIFLACSLVLVTQFFICSLGKVIN